MYIDGIVKGSKMGGDNNKDSNRVGRVGVREKEEEIGRLEAVVNGLEGELRAERGRLRGVGWDGEIGGVLATGGDVMGVLRGRVRGLGIQY